MAQQTKAAAKTLPREPSLPRQSESSCRFSAYICLHNEHKGFALHFLKNIYFPSASLRKALSIQNLSQIDRPWENVTLNRCLFVAITILVLTSGFQRLNGEYKKYNFSKLHVCYG